MPGSGGPGDEVQRRPRMFASGGQQAAEFMFAGVGRVEIGACPEPYGELFSSFGVAQRHEN